MELNRKPYQGILNIILFNWHFYVVAATLIIAYFLMAQYLPELIRQIGFYTVIFTILTTVFSLLISYYVYDLSDLYKLNWLPDSNNQKVLNINAGFDETSEIIRRKHPNVELTICDFYDVKKHTEVSIKRARKAYPPSKDTIAVKSEKLPFKDNHFDSALAILSAHEIRDDQERIEFFRELNRITKLNGRIFVTEHLRDLSNFIAYTFGFFHFHSKTKWLSTFDQANLSIEQKIKTTPFITTFILQPNDTSS